jgi:acyl-CoA synthetase (AMP-forming)/AMP-acid ligase II
MAGVGKGDRVAVLLGNGVAFPMLFAVPRTGAIAVPIPAKQCYLNPLLADDRPLRRTRS